MALIGTNRGTGGRVASSSVFGITPSSTITAGSFAVLVVAYDNSGSQGADPLTGVSDGLGNIWTSRQAALNDPGAANAGSTLRIFTSQIVTQITTINTISVSFSGNTSAASGTLTEFTSDINYTIDYVTGGIATGSSTTPSILSGSISSGNAILGAMANEGNATITADSDTSNGSWSTQQTINAGTGTSGMQVASQYKITTGTGTQTYNLTLSATGDWCIAYIEIKETAPTESFDPFGRMGFFGI